MQGAEHPCQSAVIDQCCQRGDIGLQAGDLGFQLFRLVFDGFELLDFLFHISDGEEDLLVSHRFGRLAVDEGNSLNGLVGVGSKGHDVFFFLLIDEGVCVVTDFPDLLVEFALRDFCGGLQPIRAEIPLIIEVSFEFNSLSYVNSGKIPFTYP